MSWTEGLPTHEIISRLMKENEGLRKRNKNLRTGTKQLQRAYNARSGFTFTRDMAQLKAEKAAMESDRDGALKLARASHNEAMKVRDILKQLDTSGKQAQASAGGN